MSENQSVKSPIKKLQLSRETVKKLGVRSGVRTGAAVQSYIFNTGNGGASLGASASGPPRDTFACIIIGGGDNGLP